MRTLAVFCHPSPDSFGAALWERITARLAGTVPLRRVDLYAGHESPALEPAFDDLRWAEALVLVYPTWWSSFPAALQAWIELHLTEEEAMRHIHRVVAVTTHGSGRVVNLLQGRVGRRIVKRGLLSMAHPTARARFVAFYGMDTASPAARESFSRRAEAIVVASVR